MQKDGIRWNKKHRDETQPSAPSPIVMTYHAHAVQGRALDIATGNGRNAYYNEPLHAFLPLRIIHYREGPSDNKGEARPVASLVAVKT